MVHFYNNLEVEVLYGILREEIDDIRMLYRTFFEIIEAHERKDEIGGKRIVLAQNCLS